MNEIIPLIRNDNGTVLFENYDALKNGSLRVPGPISAGTIGLLKKL